MVGPSSWARRVLAGVLAMGAGGCATITGAATGPFTGAVNLPAEIYHAEKSDFEDTPLYWAPNVLVFGPVGIATGAAVGLAKGIALDVEWLLGDMDYDEAFGTTRRASIWRPFSLDWSELR